MKSLFSIVGKDAKRSKRVSARNLALGPPQSSGSHPHSPSKVLLCHYNEEEGVWEKISIPEEALDHHLERHEMDALPG